MADYDKKRITRLFDDLAAAEKTPDKQTGELDRSIPQLVRLTAFQRLELVAEDVLLDVGTGTGESAIAASYICRQVIGIDISKKSLERASEKVNRMNLDNIIFAHGSFEEPCSELNLLSYGITKILVLYSLHHLPDILKKDSLSTLVNLLNRPGRMVIGDIIFFEDANKHLQRFDEVFYDGGNTDYPSTVEYLIECLKQLGANLNSERIHPLAGVLVADFN